MLNLINGCFELLLRPFHTVHPAFPLLLFGLLTAAMAMLCFRYASNQQAIRQCKDRIQAHILAVRLFQDHMGVVLGSYVSIILSTLAYLRYSLLPLALLSIPLLLILPQLEMRFGWASPQLREPFLLNVRLAPGVSLDTVELRLSQGLRMTAAPVRLPARREASWRLEADRYGKFAVEVVAAGTLATKQVTVTDGMAALPVARAKGIVRQLLRCPAEAPLDASSPFESIELRYRPAAVSLAGFHTPWWAVFFLASFGFAVVLKSVLRVEF